MVVVTNSTSLTQICKYFDNLSSRNGSTEGEGVEHFYSGTELYILRIGKIEIPARAFQFIVKNQSVVLCLLTAKDMVMVHV